MGNRKRLTAFLLTAVMILTMPQMQIAAAEVESPADVGLCIHHTQHTEDCGYTEGEKETPCGHAHTEDCYAPMKQCVHEHGESCYPVAEDSASENTAEREPHTCTHECSEESGCITEKLDCRHEHNADCGYSPATEGTPCTYECEACSVQEQINALPNVEDSPRENAEEIEALLAVAADSANKPTEGDGTEQSPYQITNAEELAWFRDTVNSGQANIHARLLRDIDLKNVIWEPIGTKEKPYNGTFDGNAYTIRNFWLGNHAKQEGISEKGLFGRIGSDGTIQDLVVKVECIGSAAYPNNFNITKCGLIAAYNAGTIRRCSVMVNYTLYVAGEIGIIAYRNNGIIENCLSAVGTGTGNPKFPGRIPDEASAAGIAYENSGTIKSCLFDGKLRTDGVTGNFYTAKDYAIAKGGTITNCYYYHSNTEVSGELYKDGDSSTVISKTQKEMASGEVTWLLNEEGQKDIWRQRKIGSADISLNKSYGRVKKDANGTYSIVIPHIHRLDNGTQTEFKEVHSLDEITKDNSNTKYYCLSENVTLNAAWAAPNREISLCLNGKSITAQSDAPAITVFIGKEVELDWEKQDLPMVSRRILVTKPEINGKTLGSMHFRSMYGVNVTRINRSGMDLFADPNLILQVGDRVMVVGQQDAVERVAGVLGNQLKRLDTPNIVTIFVGIFLGILLGSLPIAFPGMPTPLKLGLAGGPLVVAILIGRFGHKLKLVTYTTMSANLMLREIGIVLFLASVGIDAGANFVQTVVEGDGLLYVGCGFLITVIPLLIIGAIARLYYKVNYFTLMGLIAGSNTDPPALAYANQTTSGDAPAVGYSTVYPLSMFLRILTGQMILLTMM